MIEITQTIPKERIDKTLSWCERSIGPHLTRDVSSYARGRSRCWIRHEPGLVSPFTSTPALDVPQQTWERFQEVINFKFDYWLITFSGIQSIGIAPHRDAGYADYEAYGLSVNAGCQFNYWNNRQSFGFSRDTGLYPPSGPPSHEIYMVPGTVIRFNCKNLHSAIPTQQRWGMNFWKAK